MLTVDRVDKVVWAFGCNVIWLVLDSFVWEVHRGLACKQMKLAPTVSTMPPPHVRVAPPQISEMRHILFCFFCLCQPVRAFWRQEQSASFISCVLLL